MKKLNKIEQTDEKDISDEKNKKVKYKQEKNKQNNQENNSNQNIKIINGIKNLDLLKITKLIFCFCISIAIIFAINKVSYGLYKSVLDKTYEVKVETPILEIEDLQSEEEINSSICYFNVKNVNDENIVSTVNMRYQIIIPNDDPNFTFTLYKDGQEVPFEDNKSLEYDIFANTPTCDNYMVQIKYLIDDSLDSKFDKEIEIKLKSYQI